MSCLDLISRHYSLRTINTTVHATFDTRGTRSTRFIDGESMSWLFLQFSRQSLESGPGVGGDSESIDRKVAGDRKGGAGGNMEVIMEDVEVRLLREHCAAPKWSINLEFDDPPTPNPPKLKPDQDPEQFLHRIITLKPDATVDKVETMFLDPTRATSEEGTASNRAGLGSSGVPEGWEVRDGKAWFAGKFPARAALVEHEEVWLVVRGKQVNVSAGAVMKQEEEVGGYITTLSDPEPNEGTIGKKSDGRRRMYISSLLVYPSYRRKGLGRALLRHAIGRARTSPQGPALVCLTVFCDNTGARGMYLAEGFVVTQKLWVIRASGVVDDE